jgi:capsular polysaccharide biosynthesis protein
LELREYWAIITRRWRLIAAITAVTLLASTLMLAIGPKSYKSEIRLTVSVRPEPRLGEYYTYDRYYTWLTAEYLVDDLGEVIRSDAFTKDVSERLGGMYVSKEWLQRNISTQKTHRILTVSVTTDNPHNSFVVAKALKETIEEKAPEYFAQLDTEGAMIRMLDDPAAEAEMGRFRMALEIGLRTSVGLLAAIALAFLLNYLDMSVRTRKEAEQLLGLPVLAEIPNR